MVLSNILKKQQQQQQRQQQFLKRTFSVNAEYYFNIL